MRLGALLYLLWFLILPLSFAAVVLHLVRHKTRRVHLALLCPAGALLMFGLVSAGIGLAEATWTWSSPGLWIALILGTGGIALAAIGGHAVLQSPLLPGRCRECGYDLAGLARCPECGRSSTPG